jgi:hypothetical protein
VTLVDPDELFGASDALSVHAPLLPSTRGMVGTAAIGRMPEGALLVDTSRGGVVDHEAVIAALRSGRLAGAALDVHPEEPVDAAAGARYLGVPSLLLTPAPRRCDPRVERADLPRHRRCGRRRAGRDVTTRSSSHAHPSPGSTASRRPSVLCVGIAVVDVIAHARGDLVPGVKQFADRITSAFGGPATTAAAAAARLGVDVELVAAIGDDDRGVQLRAALEARGVRTDRMPVRAGVGTAASLVIITPDGERTIVNVTDPALRAPLDPGAAGELIARAGMVDAVLVDVRWPAAAALALAGAARAAVPACSISIAPSRTSTTGCVGSRAPRAMSSPRVMPSTICSSSRGARRSRTIVAAALDALHRPRGRWHGRRHARCRRRRLA